MTTEELEARASIFVRYGIPVAVQLRKDHPEGNWVGQIKCPVCGGVLTATVSPDRKHHTSGACEKKGCLRWIE